MIGVADAVSTNLADISSTHERLFYVFAQAMQITSRKIHPSLVSLVITELFALEIPNLEHHYNIIKTDSGIYQYLIFWQIRGTSDLFLVFSVTTSKR